MDRDLEHLPLAMSEAYHPYVAIFGGTKLSDTMPLIDALIDRKVDTILIGGALAYTFLKAQGFTVGKSLVESNLLDAALAIMRRAETAGVELLLPTDHQVVDSYEPIKGDKIIAKTIPIEFTNAGHAGMDIGIETVAHFTKALRHARAIIWHGPMGVFEEPPFDQGTINIAGSIAEAAKNGARVAVEGRATREFLAAADLPNVAALAQGKIPDREETNIAEQL